jgi:zinc protease
VGKDAAAFAEALEQLGASIDVSTGHTSSTVTLTTRKAELPRALDLLADAIVHPTFKKKSFARERDLAVSALAANADEPVAVATRLAWARWFGAGHPYANPTDGTLAGLRGVGVKQVKARWQEAWGADGATFTVAGDVTLEEVVPLLESRLGAAWKPGQRVLPAVPAVAPRSARSVVVVDKPGASQTMFSLVFPGAALGTPEVAPARVGTIALGGTFTSRLNALLREKRGYTYGVRASLVALPGTGILTIGTRIRTDATGPAMADLLGELDSIQKGITPAELVKARSAYRQDLVEAMESRAGTASSFAGWHVAGLSPTALDADLASTGATEREAVTTAMQAYDPSKVLIVLVGDLAVIKPGLEAAGVSSFEVVEPL